MRSKSLLIQHKNRILNARHRAMSVAGILLVPTLFLLPTSAGLLVPETIPFETSSEEKKESQFRSSIPSPFRKLLQISKEIPSG